MLLEQSPSGRIYIPRDVFAMVALVAACLLCIGSNPAYGQSCPVDCPDTCTDTSDPPLDGYMISGPSNFCRYRSTGCASSNQYAVNGCCRTPYTPLIIDVDGNGIDLTDVGHGVLFRLIPGSATLYQVAWTSPQSDDAWLTLDRNGDGIIADSSELFGNLTPQPLPSRLEMKNGFLALSVYDRLSEGGNNDGVIDSADRIYSSLRLWQDRNHNGKSETGELFSLDSLGVAGFDLDYKPSRLKDKYGNEFRYRSKVFRSRGADVGRWVWDVFLTVGAPSSRGTLTTALTPISSDQTGFVPMMEQTTGSEGALR